MQAAFFFAILSPAQVVAQAPMQMGVPRGAMKSIAESEGFKEISMKPLVKWSLSKFAKLEEPGENENLPKARNRWRFPILYEYEFVGRFINKEGEPVPLTEAEVLAEEAQAEEQEDRKIMESPIATAPPLPKEPPLPAEEVATTAPTVSDALSARTEASPKHDVETMKTDAMDFAKQKLEELRAKAAMEQEKKADEEGKSLDRRPTDFSEATTTKLSQDPTTTTVLPVAEQPSEDVQMDSDTEADKTPFFKSANAAASPKPAAVHSDDEPTPRATADQSSGRRDSFYSFESFDTASSKKPSDPRKAAVTQTEAAPSPPKRVEEVEQPQVEEPQKPPTPPKKKRKKNQPPPPPPRSPPPPVAPKQAEPVAPKEPEPLVVKEVAQPPPTPKEAEPTAATTRFDLEDNKLTPRFGHASPDDRGKISFGMKFKAAPKKISPSKKETVLNDEQEVAPFKEEIADGTSCLIIESTNFNFTSAVTKLFGESELELTVTTELSQEDCEAKIGELDMLELEGACEEIKYAIDIDEINEAFEFDDMYDRVYVNLPIPSTIPDLFACIKEHCNDDAIVKISTENSSKVVVKMAEKEGFELVSEKPLAKWNMGEYLKCDSKDATLFEFKYTDSS